MLMRKHILLFLLLTSVTTSLLAGNVSRQAAMKIASDFFIQHGKQLTSQPALAKSGSTSQSRGAQADYYVFNASGGDGFVIVSGDDTTMPVLGYVEHGSYDEATQPAALKALLASYAAQIEAVGKGSAAPRRAAVLSGEAIEPLLTTTWGQGEPYNNATPTYTTYGSGGLEEAHCATGCVATAMSQLMYYHRSPNAVVADIPAYTPFDDPTRQRVSGVPAGSVIDYDNMLTDYQQGSYTTAQATAVANLMLYAGVSVKMGYDEESAAALASVPNALMKYFGYQNVVYVQRTDYKLATWEGMIYDQLAARQPVIVGGQSSSFGGHAFMVDGFRTDGYFHVNWGWEGSYSGYFLLSVADPYADAYGSADTGRGFNFDQEAVFTRASLVRDKDRSTAAPNFSVAFSFPGENVSGQSQTVEMTLTNNGDEFYKPIYLFASPSQTMRDYYEAAAGLSLGQGEVKAVTMSFTPDEAGTWTVWLSTDQEGQNVVGSAQVEIKEPNTGLFRLAKCQAEGTVNTTYGDGTITSTLNTKHLQLTLWLENTADYDITQRVRFQFQLEKLDEATGSYNALTYMSMTTTSFPASTIANITGPGGVSPIDFGTYEAGTYRMRLIANNEDMDTRYHFVIPEDTSAVTPTEEPDFRLAVCQAEGTVKTDTINGEYYSTLSGNDLLLTISVLNATSRTFSDTVHFVFLLERLDDTTGNYSGVSYLSSDIVGFGAGATYNIPGPDGSATVNFGSHSPGTYRLRLVADDVDMDTRYHFVIPVPSGINAPRIDATDDAWYTIDGRRLPAKPSRKGLYIHRGKKVTIL